MKKLDERGIIAIFEQKLGTIGRAEDVEVFCDGSSNIITAIDTLVESTDVPVGMKAREVARKSIAACVSDFAAKGVKPEFAIISVVLPAKYSRKKITELADGFACASKEFGFKIIGGDTNQGVELSISAVLYAKTDKIVKRSGAKKGDLIFVTGPFGNAAAGLDLLVHKTKTALTRHMIESFLHPKPKLAFGVKIKKYISSAMDSSDGLALTLNEMAAQSKKKFVITRLPHDKKLEAYAKIHKKSIKNLVLFGGEEYETVFTVSQQNSSRIKSIAKKDGIPIQQIGDVKMGQHVTLEIKNQTQKIANKGWQHFK